MSQKMTVIFLLGVFIFSACGSPGSIEILETPTNEWRIVFVHSGGFAGLMRALEISSDGSYTLKDERTNFTKSGQITDNELADLSRILVGINYVPQTKPTGCADCFIYDIRVTGGGNDFSARVDDVNIDDSGLRLLVSALREIMDRELRSQ